MYAVIFTIGVVIFFAGSVLGLVVVSFSVVGAAIFYTTGNLPLSLIVAAIVVPFVSYGLHIIDTHRSIKNIKIGDVLETYKYSQNGKTVSFYLKDDKGAESSYDGHLETVGSVQKSKGKVSVTGKSYYKLTVRPVPDEDASLV